MVPEASAATWPRAAGESATGLEDAVYSQQWEPDLGPDSTLRWKSLAPATHGLLKALARTPSQAASTRSEEHTSELQSRENLVCRLLLEKKKKSSQYN